MTPPRAPGVVYTPPAIAADVTPPRAPHVVYTPPAIAADVTPPRAPGVVYTPPAIAAELVARALDPIVAPLVAARDAAAIGALRVCDPAVGEGAIAVAIVDHLALALAAIRDASASTAADRESAGRCVVGMDVDRAALAVARARVPGADLRAGDALAAAWESFDAVVANPPYIRGERIADKRALERFAVYEPTADLYAYFIELAHRIMRPGGRYAIVVPQKWMTAAYGRNLRALLARTVHGIAAAREFPDADAFPCIVWGATAPAAAPLLVATERGARTRASLGDDTGPLLVATDRGARTRASLGDDTGPLLVATDRGARTRASFGDDTAPLLVATDRGPRTRTSLGDGTAPWHLDSADAGALLDRLARAFPPLAAQIEGRPQRGVVTGCNAAFVVDRATRDALLAADPANAALVRALVRGRDLVHLVHLAAHATADRADDGDLAAHATADRADDGDLVPLAATADRADDARGSRRATGDVVGSRVAGQPSRGGDLGSEREHDRQQAARRRGRVAGSPSRRGDVGSTVAGPPSRDGDDRARFVLLIDHGTEPTPSILAHLAQFRVRLEPGGPGGRKPGRYRWFELQDPLNHALANPAPRILYQDIQSAPLAALDDGALVPDTTLWMLPTADPWILAVLRSPLYAFHARHRFPPALNGSWRPKWEYLRALPIAPAPPGWTVASGPDAVAEAYALTAAERRLVATPSKSNSSTPITSATSATLNTGHR